MNFASAIDYWSSKFLDSILEGAFVSTIIKVLILILFSGFCLTQAIEVDITHILKEEGIDQKLNREAPGNEGSGSLESARIDLDTGKFSAKARMKYKHVNFKVLGKEVGPPTVNFNVFIDGHIAPDTNGSCTLYVDSVRTSNDLFKALVAVGNIFVNTFTLGKYNIGSWIKEEIGSHNFDCGFTESGATNNPPTLESTSHIPERYSECPSGYTRWGSGACHSKNNPDKTTQPY